MDIIRKKPSTKPYPARPWPQPQTSTSEQATSPAETLYITRQDIEKFAHAETNYQKKLRLKRFLKISFALIFLCLLLTGGFLLGKAYATSKKISAGQTQQTSFSTDMRAVLSGIMPGSERQSLQGEQDGRINILLLGAAGEKKPGQNLTDTVMLMSVDTKNKKLALLSLPRDLYVQIPASTRGDASSTRGGPHTNTFTKLNSLYQIGLKQGEGANLIKTSVEKITGLPIQYYLVVNFDGFEKIIDDLGGVNVTVERDIYDPRYPGPNYSYQTFELKKGFHSLDGATALKYVRERHDDPQGDFGRAARQQQVLQAVKNKLFSAQTLFNAVAISNLLDTLGDNVKTNISLEEMESFLALAKKVDTQNINNAVVDAWRKDSLLKVSHVEVGNVRAFILVPRVGNFSEIQDLAANIFNREVLQKRLAHIQTENAAVAIINQSSDPRLAGKIKMLLTDKLGFAQVDILPDQDAAPLTQSQVWDLSDGSKIYSLDELVKKIPAVLTDKTLTQIIPAKTDLVVILGEDAAENYKYEEDSVEDYNKAQNDNNNFNFTKAN